LHSHTLCTIGVALHHDRGNAAAAEFELVL